jgi:hypothetical protein
MSGQPVSLASGFAIPGAVNDRKHRNLARRVVHGINNDIRRFHEFARAFDQPRPPDVREARNCKAVDPRENALD